MKKIILALVFAATSVVLVPTSALAQVNVNIVIGNAPPPLRYEVVPASRPGYVWAPGYWNWNGDRHIWSGGHWERSRSGQVFSRSEWRQEGDGWRLQRGGWQRGRGDDDRRDDDHGKKYKEKHKDKHKDKHEDKYEDNGYHCPPGQAKKGNC